MPSFAGVPHDEVVPILVALASTGPRRGSSLPWIFEHLRGTGEHQGHIGLAMELVHEARWAGEALRYVRLTAADGSEVGVAHSAAPVDSSARRLLQVLGWEAFPRCPWVGPACIAGVLAYTPAGSPRQEGAAQLIFGDLPDTLERWAAFETAWQAVRERLGPDGPSMERLIELFPHARASASVGANGDVAIHRS